MSEQNIEFYSDRPVLQNWGLNITNEKGEQPTNEQYIEMFDSLKDHIEVMADKGFESIEIHSLTEEEDFNGWAYVINENDNVDNYKFSMCISTTIEKDFSVDVEFSLASMSSENYNEDVEEVLEYAELDEEQIDLIQACLDAQIHSGKGEILIDCVQLNYCWKVNK